MERDKIVIDKTNLYKKNETCDTHLDRDRRNVSVTIAREFQGDQKDPNRQHR